MQVVDFQHIVDGKIRKIREMSLGVWAALCRFVPLREKAGEMFGLSGSFALPLDAPNQCKWLISGILLMEKSGKAGKCHSESGPLCAALCRFVKKQGKCLGSAGASPYRLTRQINASG
jgi:hypothetical protein